MDNPIRIFLVDDHTVLRAGLKMLLNAEKDMLVVGESSDIASAAVEIATAKPDIVLLDVSLPVETGLEGLQTLQKQSPSSHFLILTMHNDEQYLRLAMAQGAMGYLIKQAANEELLSAIRVVHQGGTYLQPAHRSLLFSNQPGTLEKPQEILEEKLDDNPHECLSPREFEILVLLASGYTNRQAANELFLSEKTIETYKARLMTKLHLGTRIDLVRYAIQHGLVKS